MQSLLIAATGRSARAAQVKTSTDQRLAHLLRRHRLRRSHLLPFLSTTTTGIALAAPANFPSHFLNPPTA